MNDPHYDPRCTTGLKLRKLRYLHGLEQKQLAARLKISQSYYAKMERQYKPGHAKYLPLLATIYNLHERYLLEPCGLDLNLDHPAEFSKQYCFLVEKSSF